MLGARDCRRYGIWNIGDADRVHVGRRCSQCGGSGNRLFVRRIFGSFEVAVKTQLSTGRFPAP